MSTDTRSIPEPIGPGSVVVSGTDKTRMTVEKISDDGRTATCQWFEGATLKEGEFSTDTLRRASGGVHNHLATGKLDIGEAIARLHMGLRVQREGWNGPNQYLELQVPDAHSKMTLPYIYIHTVQHDLVPWLASQTDILAHDWRVVE